MALSNTMGLTVRFKADITSLIRGIKRVNSELNNRFKAGIGTAISAVKRLSFAIVGVGGLVYALGRLGASTVDIENKFAVVFRGVENIAMDWANRMHESFNLPMRDLKAYLSQLQDTLFPLLKNREEAAKLSVELAQLALDAASFYNVPVDEAIERFTSALVGNHEAVRQFGVVLTEAELKAEALRQGIEKNWNEMTNAEKATLRLKLITENMADAQGDFARTADEGSNTFRTLWANIKDLGSALGEQIADGLTKANNGFTDLFSKMADYIRKSKTIKKLTKEVGDAISEATSHIMAWVDVGGVELAWRKLLSVALRIKVNWQYIALAYRSLKVSGAKLAGGAKRGFPGLSDPFWWATKEGRERAHTQNMLMIQGRAPLTQWEKTAGKELAELRTSLAETQVDIEWNKRMMASLEKAVTAGLAKKPPEEKTVPEQAEKAVTKITEPTTPPARAREITEPATPARARETEVLRQAVSEGVTEALTKQVPSARQSRPLEVHISIDGREIAKAVANEIDREWDDIASMRGDYPPEPEYDVGVLESYRRGQAMESLIDRMRAWRPSTFGRIH